MKKRTTLLGAIIIASIAFITYLPALKIQFYDGWWYLIWSASMDFPRFLVQFLDPSNITQGYRPVQGIYMYLLFHLFGFNPDGYHLAHNLLNAANAVLLFLLVGRLAHNKRLAFVAACFYAVFPNYSLAVFWHAVVDPLAGFFYLLTMLLWTRFLDTRRRSDYVFAFLAFVLALLSKEIAIFLPLFLFLIEWWFYREKPNWRVDVPRYLPFLLTFVPYLYQVYQVQSHGEFTGQFGFKIGPHMLNNLIPYLAVLAFPWTTELPTHALVFIWLSIAAVVYIGIMVYKKSTALLFLALFAVLNISPLLGFPLDYFNTRYLYLPTAASAVVLAMLAELGWRFLGTRRVSAIVGVAVVAGVLLSSAQVADAAAGLAEYTRQVRVPFRDISRAHPTFSPGTLLYFVYSPLAAYWDFEGLFYSRYGTTVTVGSTDFGNSPDLRRYNSAYVYYFDASGKPIEIAVDRNVTTHTTTALPAQFAGPIRLERYQVPGAEVQRGKALVAILDWSTEDKPGENYTVFAHLVDSNGKVVAGYDSPPKRGEQQTSTWKRGQLYVDVAVLPVDPDAPVGQDYRLEIGLYNAATMQRLPLVDASGATLDDKIVIAPFSIVP